MATINSANTADAKKAYKKIIMTWAALTIAYISITLLLPPDPVSLARYNVSAWQLRLIGLSVSIPLAGIWFAAFYGYAKFKEYALTIKGTKDAHGLSIISDGLKILAFGLPLSSLISTTMSFFSRNPSLTETSPLAPVAVITNVYVALIIAVLAYITLRKGSTELIKVNNFTVTTSDKTKNTIFFVIATIVYVFLVFLNPNRQVPSAPGFRATFYLPDWLIVLTIMLPYLYAWYSGFVASMNIVTYKKNTTGTIYKKALSGLSLGISTVIAVTIALQFFGTIGGAISKLNLSSILILVYVLLLAISAGYIIIARSAKKLTKIETVV